MAGYKNKQKTKSCSIFGYKTNNTLFVGRNYDWIPILENIFQIYKINNASCFSFTAISDMSIIDKKKISPNYHIFQADDAINQEGLFIGITFAYANDIYIGGISPIHMTRLITEKCKTVDDAICLFKNIPICCPKNFFIADRLGNMVVIEHTSKTFKIIYPKDNILIKTNHYLHEELTTEDIILKVVPSHNSFIRYFELLQQIKLRKKFHFDSISQILRNPDLYVYQNTKYIKTIWTLCLDVVNKKYRIYFSDKGKNKFLDLC